MKTFTYRRNRSGTSSPGARKSPIEKSPRKNHMLGRIITKRAAILAGSLSAMGFAGSSRADVVSFSESFPAVLGSFSTPFTLSQFDPSLGTLTGATITYSTTMTPEVSIIDITGAGGTYANATLTARDDFTGPDGYSGNFSAEAGPFSGTVAPSGSPPTFTTTPGTPTPNSTLDSILPTDFADFTGLGNVSFTFESGPQTPNGSPGGTNIFIGGNSTDSGEASIAYTYTAVPEPASLSIIGIGAAMLLRRRRPIVKT
jgi:PEP-CTERM motif